MDPRDILPVLRKKRSHVKGLLTEQANRVQELERTEPSPEVAELASELLKKIRCLDDDFKKIHFEILECIDEEDEASLEKKQETFGLHDDRMEAYYSRVNKLVTSSSALEDKNMKIIRLKLRKLKSKIESTYSTITEDEDTVDCGLLKSVSRELDDYRAALRELEDNLISMDLPEDHELFDLYKEADALRFDCQQQCDKLSLQSSTSPSPDVASRSDICKLKKLNIPKFDGNIMMWEQFWDRFKTTVHENRSFTYADKWEYLHQALMDGPAKDSLSGFSRSEAQYDDAVKWLIERYNQPREVIKQHTRAIAECHGVKEADSRELRRLHSVWSQHTRALEELGHRMDPAILTCLLELKLDKPTLAKWKWETRMYVTDVPEVTELFTFIKDQAAALDSQVQEKKRLQPLSTDKKSRGWNKPVHSLTTNLDSSQSRCVVCPNDKHPLYACDAFRNMSHEDEIYPETAWHLFQLFENWACCF